MKVGFIGLGIMGRPMAVNLAKAGHQLFVRARKGVPEEVAATGDRRRDFRCKRSMHSPKTVRFRTES